jgi:glycosyltransferase involved in cell wall biosynthesis
MKISVILSNYNGERHIGETLDAVLAQTRPPDELVVVDDASADGSIQVIEGRLGRAEFDAKLIRHEKNGGQAAGFNTAFRAATGELVCTLDADDLWRPEKLAVVEEEAAKRKEFAIIQHQMEIYRDGEWTGRPVLPALATGDVWRLWLDYSIFPNFLPTSGLSFHRSALEKVLPMPETLRISADSFLTRSAIAHGPLVSIEEPLGGYRIHGGNSVAGNAGHDSWKFFTEKVRPLLLAYYREQGLEVPTGYMQDPPTRRGSPLLDVSVRKILQKFGILKAYH